MRARTATSRSATGRTSARALLASAGVKERSGTAPPYRMDDRWRLALWLALVAVLIALGYGSRAADGKPEPTGPLRMVDGDRRTGPGRDPARPRARDRRFQQAARLPSARRAPTRRPRGRSAAPSSTIYVFEIVYGRLVRVGNEQGLTPSHWEPHHAAAYVVNAIVICTWVPFVEELTYRGLGYSLLERFGRWPAIILVGLLFGLAHGLIESLPVLAVFGGVLAWIRSRTDSVYPGMVLHALFNLVALVAAVTL